MKKKFTVFGHSGFLGKNVVNYLIKNGFKYFLPPRNKYKFKKNLNNVIFCIGSDNVFNNPINAINANLKILIEVIENNRFDSFLFISSTRIYLGSKKTREIDEININPNNPTYLFNLLKLASENYCLSKKNKNIKIVRLSNLYGEYFKDQIYLLPTLLRNIKRNKKITITINKNSKKNYLDVNDAIPLFLKILKKSKYKIYNIASNRSYSLSYIIQNLKINKNFKIEYKNQKTRYDEPRINIDRVKKEFKFKTKDNFKEFLIKHS